MHSHFVTTGGTVTPQEAVGIGRAGKAGDTITVVIYSKLPVIYMARHGYYMRVHAHMTQTFNLQKYVFSST